jgi:hypothetical protein
MSTAFVGTKAWVMIARTKFSLPALFAGEDLLWLSAFWPAFFWTKNSVSVAPYPRERFPATRANHLHAREMFTCWQWRPLVPLTSKGEKILSNLQSEYGSDEKAKQVLYAGKNKGTFSGIDCDKIGRIADAVNNLAKRFDAIVDADNEWHVQFKTRDKSGKEHNE